MIFALALMRVDRHCTKTEIHVGHDDKPTEER